MKERTIEVELNGKPVKVFAGNAALIRYRKAGGSMTAIETLDGEEGVDGLFDKIDSLTLLIHSNLVVGGISIENFVNGLSSMEVLFTASNDLFSGVPWLGNQVATGTKSN